MNRRVALSTLGSAVASFAILGGGRPLSARWSSDTSATDRLQELDLDQLLRRAAVPSLALVLMDRGRVTTRVAGVRRSGESTPTSPDTVYAAASLTKPVVAYTLLSLAGEGVLSLDRPLHEYLPLPNTDDTRARTITARHLLSHSGGWRNWRNDRSQALTADFAPGSRWSYSGEGYFFLQRVLEKLTGRALGTLVRERVFAPLGMSRSALALSTDLEPHLAVGHNFRGEPIAPFGRAALVELRRIVDSRGESLDAARVEDAEEALRLSDPNRPVLPNFLVPNAAASLLTTVNDFARFLQQLLEAPAAGGKGREIVAQMFSPQVRCNEVLQWGLGVGLEETTRGLAAWQWGDNPGYKHFFFANPTAQTAIVVFTNGDRGARVYERVIRQLTGEDRAAFLFA